MDKEKVGLFIGNLRKEKNISQESLSNMLHVDRTLISKWENGKVLPDVEMMIKLCSIFDVEIDELIYGERKSNKNKNDIKNSMSNYLKRKEKMYKKIRLILLVLLLFILLSSGVFAYVYFTNRNVKMDDNYELEVIKKHNCSNEIKEYYEFSLNSGRVYFVCIDEIYLRGLHDKTLYYYFANTYADFSDQLKHITDNMDLVETYRDGGTKIYKKYDLTIIECHKIDGNRDVYFGDSSLTYQDGFCENTVVEFVGKLLKINEDSVLLDDPNDDTCDTLVHVSNIDEVKDKLKVGDSVTVLFNGFVNESCPGQIYGQIKITE